MNAPTGSDSIAALHIPKRAAMEGQFVTERGAPLRIGGIPHYAFQIVIGLGSLMMLACLWVLFSVVAEA